MQVIIAHSHLNPGGVTRIIESQVKCLADYDVTVVAGNCGENYPAFSGKTKCISFGPLNYLEHKKYSESSLRKKLQETKGFLETILKKDAILHVHNLNLGKNPVTTYAVFLLTKEGYTVFNHAHDFAEDRPANYQFLKEIIEGNFNEKLSEVLYPDLPNYHFGVLNSFDFDRLVSYGVAKERIEWLPNPVEFRVSKNVPNKKVAKKGICSDLLLDEKKLLVTYPVRVIHRKNIGEFLLLSVLFQETANFCVTQPPLNPEEIKLYQKWLDFCGKKKIPVVFEAGKKVDFETLLTASDFCISTSYKEGFGMVYVEPWLADTPVVGRNIRYITRDFVHDGLILPALYDELKIPGTSGDFPLLTMEQQMQLIEGVSEGKIKQQSIFELNPRLKTLFEKVGPDIMKNNKNIIERNYSLHGYRDKLQKRYRKMVEKPG